MRKYSSDVRVFESILIQNRNLSKDMTQTSFLVSPTQEMCAMKLAVYVFNWMSQNDHVLKMLNFFLPFDPAGKLVATMLLHSWLYLIWYATWPCSETVECWPFDPTPPGSGVGYFGQNICYRFAAFVMSFYLYYLIGNVSIFWKKLNFDLLTQPLGSGDLWLKYLLPCCCLCHSL